MTNTEKKELLDKVAEWIETYLFEIGYPDDWLRDSKVLISGKTRFYRDMMK